MASKYLPGATVLDAIGATPLIQVDGIFVKLEYLNPSGSIKARMARYIIERAEREGLLRPGDTIVEASSGNTGNAMSMVAAVLGYKMLVVMPEGLSPGTGRRFHLPSGPRCSPWVPSTSMRRWMRRAASVVSPATSPPTSSNPNGTLKRIAPGSVPRCSSSYRKEQLPTHS